MNYNNCKIFTFNIRIERQICMGCGSSADKICANLRANIWDMQNLAPSIHLHPKSVQTSPQISKEMGKHLFKSNFGWVQISEVQLRSSGGQKQQQNTYFKWRLTILRFFNRMYCFFLLVPWWRVQFFRVLSGIRGGEHLYQWYICSKWSSKALPATFSINCCLNGILMKSSE